MKKINRKTVTIIFFILIVIISVLTFLFKKEIAKKENCCANCVKSSDIFPSIFFDNQLFLAGENLSDQEFVKTEKIKGGIIPHHLLAGQFISDFFKRISPEIQTVILIGPNHKESGIANIMSVWNNWNTPFGIVEIDKCVMDYLNKKDILTIDKGSTMKMEHSMGSIMPYIKKYLPQAKVVPIILKQKIEKEKLDSMAQELSKVVKKDGVLLIASIDFSHYLSSMEAEKKDAETKNAIEENDYATIAGFNNDHLDSSASLILLLKTFEIYKNISHEIISHSNSGKILNQKNINETTSYFEIIFTKK